MEYVDLAVSLHFRPFINAYIPCSIVNGTGGILLALTYFPKRGSDSGSSKKEILGRVDYTGAILSIAGLTLLSVFCYSNVLVDKV
jgi:hypothetical protein